MHGFYSGAALFAQIQSSFHNTADALQEPANSQEHRGLVSQSGPRPAILVVYSLFLPYISKLVSYLHEQNLISLLMETFTGNFQQHCLSQASNPTLIPAVNWNMVDL